MSFHDVSAAFVLGMFVTVVACGDPDAPRVATIDSTTMPSASVAPAIHPERTYEYDFSAVRIDSVLLALGDAGLPLSQAWYPLAYLCEDVRGARLTVELDTADDARMATHDFMPGTGRLRCSEMLRRYVVRELGMR